MTYYAEDSVSIDACWLDVKSMNVGKLPKGEGTPNRYYLVFKNNEPYLLVKVYYEYISPFQSFTIWNNLLFIGMPEYVVYIDLLTFTKERFDLDKSDLYFNCFYQYSGVLLLASSNKLYCLDDECLLLWKTKHLGVDGVIIHDFKDTYLIVSGELDPPGGWVNYRVDIKTGKEFLMN